MKASKDWLTSSGADFSPSNGRYGFAHLRNYSVGYQEWGQGPPIILIPGLAGSYGLLGPISRILSQNHRVISYHLRGEDDCFTLRQDFGINDLVDDLAEFIDWHCLEKPDIFGVSFGGIVGLEFAARHPHRLRNLIVQGAGARLDKGLLATLAGTVLSRYPLPADNPFLNQFFNLLFGNSHHSHSLFKFVTRQCWQTDQSVMAHRFHLVEHFDIENRLEQIKAPTLILRGDKDILVSEKNIQDLEKGISQSLMVRISGTGHLAFVTQPERVAAEVNRFLK